MKAEDLQSACVEMVNKSRYTDETIGLIKKRAKRGDPIALFEHSVILPAQGKFVEAAETCKRAFDRGHAQSGYRLAMLYRFGIGVEKDTSKLEKLLEESGKMGFAPATLELGICLFGQGRYKEGLKFLRIAAKGDSETGAHAKLRLASIYSVPQGVPTNRLLANRYMSEAIESGDPDALFHMGRLVQKNPHRQMDAAVYLARAAAKGHEEARGYLKDLIEDAGLIHPVVLTTSQKPKNCLLN